MAPTTAPRFVVLLGTDYAGKSSAMSALAAGVDQPWRLVSSDDAFLDPQHAVISRLRRQLVREVLPELDQAYSADFVVALLQTAVVHLRDRLVEDTGGRTALVDSYYYKILAKCRLAGFGDHAMFGWWRSFPQPQHVAFLETSPTTAWHRSGQGAAVNRLEHYGPRADRARFELFQADLRRAMLEEVRHVPVSVIPEQDSVEQTVRVLREALADVCC